MTDPRQHIMPVYRPPEEVFVEGKGAYLFTEDGTRYLDFIAGIAVTALGHAHPALVDALRDQAGKLWHTSNMFRVPAAEQLADKICRDTFADRVFFTNSGTEAIECAIKSARKYHWANGREERIDIITFTGAFHGRSIGAINAGGNPKYLEGFGPALPGFVHLEWGDHDALKEAASRPTAAAVLVEPVQGEGGVRIASDEFMKGLRALADEHDLLLVLDEVQTGVARTGTFYAYEQFGIEPDILATAKGIGGGFPLGACLATEKAARGMVVGTHGSTYGGNPLAIAAGEAVLDAVANEEFLSAVRAKGDRLRMRLEQFIGNYPDLFEAVRGRGLLIGLKMKVEPRPFVAHMRDRHQVLTVSAADNTMRIVPPLVIDDSHIDEFMEKLSAGAASYMPEELAG